MILHVNKLENGKDFWRSFHETRSKLSISFSARVKVNMRELRSRISMGLRTEGMPKKKKWHLDLLEVLENSSRMDCNLFFMSPLRWGKSVQCTHKFDWWWVFFNFCIFANVIEGVRLCIREEAGFRRVGLFLQFFNLPSVSLSNSPSFSFNSPREIWTARIAIKVSLIAI